MQILEYHSPLIMEHNLPAPFLIDALAIPRCNVVSNDLDIVCVLSYQVDQQRSNDRHHPATQDHDGYVVAPRPVIELLEIGIQLDILKEDLYTFIVGSLDRVHHLPESIPERGSAIKHILIALLPQLLSKAYVVGHEVVGVSLGDGAVEVAEEDELGGSLHGREGSCRHDGGGRGSGLEKGGFKNSKVNGRSKGRRAGRGTAAIESFTWVQLQRQGRARDTDLGKRRAKYQRVSRQEVLYCMQRVY